MLVAVRASVFLAILPALSPLAAQPTRIIVDNVGDLRACINRPAGPPLVCALKNSTAPYEISGEPLIIRRSDTTLEPASEAGQTPPTLKRTDGSMKKIIWAPRGVSHVTIQNLQFDGTKSITPKESHYFDISAEGSDITIQNNYFGNAAYYCVYIGGPHITVRNNIFGELISGGETRFAPGMDTAVKAWGVNATQFTIDGNKISHFRGAMSVTGVPNGSDPATASVINNNTLYHNAICVPDCGGGQILIGSSSNVKITNNSINGGWNENENRNTVHSYGLEIQEASYVYVGSNRIFNNSLSGIWVGNGSHHVTLENNTVYENGLNGVQVAAGGRLKPVADISIIGLKSRHNDQHRGPGGPFPTLPRFWGVMIQNEGPQSVCIQTDSDLQQNAKGAIFVERRGGYSLSAACPRPYN